MADGAIIYQGLLARGFTAPQAAALAGNIEQESSFNPAAYNAGSDAQGLLQWRLDRKTGLNAYAKATGRDPNDPNAQLDYIVNEMQGLEAKNAAAFLSAQDVQSANDALKSYIRYGQNEGGKRLQYAQAFAGQPGDSAVTPTAGFVNPAFSGGMPGVPAGPPATTGAAPTAAPPAPAPAISDDDLLKAFLPGGGMAGSSSGENPDDAFLKQFLTPTQPTKADPLAGTQQLFPGADALSALFTSGVDNIPLIGHPIINALTGFKGSLYGRSPEQQGAIEQEIRDQQPIATGTGAVIGQVAPLLAAGGVPGAARVLGMSGNLLTRIAMGGASNAAIQGVDTLERGGSLEQAGKNALVGGAVGAAAAPVADVIGGGINKLLSGTSPEVAQLAKLARDKYGIPIGPGQISDNSMVRFADSVVNKMPLSGGTASSAEQQAAFNKAIAKTFGETADRITPDVMAAAKARIGNDFEMVAQKTPHIAYDPPFENSLIQTLQDATGVLQGSEVAPLKNQIDAIVSKFAQGNGEIDGQTYQALTRKGAPLDRLLSSDNPNIEFYAGQVRDALDAALARHAPPDAQKLLQQARSQWKAMRTVEPLVAKATTGDISPPLLMGRVNSSFGNVAYGGGGDLAELSRIGQRFLKAPPSSGTAERLAILELGKKLAGPAGAGGVLTAAALNPGSIPMMLAAGIPAAAAYTAVAKGAGALLRSKTLTNKLIDNSLGAAANKIAPTMTNKLLRSAAGAVHPGTALVDDVFQGVPGPYNGQSVQIIRPSADGAGFIVQLPDGSQTFMGKNLLMAPPAQ